jgi:BMFP domain-containing protein YqiC
MSDRPKFFDDLAGVAGGAMSAFAGLREEMMSAMRARVDDAVRRMDLVKRDEFEAMAELARRARDQADALALRVAALEGSVAASQKSTDVEEFKADEVSQSEEKYVVADDEPPAAGV